MRAWRWANWWLPALLALLVAGALSDVVTDEWTRRQWAGWLVLLTVGPAAFYAAVPLVGFCCGRLGDQPAEQTRPFGLGWQAGADRRLRRH